MAQKIEEIKRMRAELYDTVLSLRSLGVGRPLGGNDANFLLVPILRRDAAKESEYDNDRAMKIYKHLAESEGVVVRYRGGELGCGGCLRITIGTATENVYLLEKLKQALEKF